MPGRLTTISIGSALRRANDRFKRGSWTDLKRYLDALETSTTVAAPAHAHGPLETSGQISHHNEFVGNGPGSFFPQIDAQLKNDVMRASIIQALRLSLYRTFKDDGIGIDPRPEPLPIVSYWITGAETFEAYVDLTAAEVHIFLVTPDPAPTLTPPNEDAAFDELMWICAAPDRVREMRERAPQYGYRDPVSMPPQLTALCQQVKGY